MIKKIKGLIGKKIELADQTLAANKRQVTKALADLNCDCKWKKNGKNEVVTYQYQGGFFEITLQPTVFNVLLSFYYLAETEVDYLQSVRYLCNNLNTYTDGPCFVYSSNEKKGNINVHLIYNVLLDDDRAKDILAKAMADIFGWRNLFIQRFEALVETQKQEKEKDVEYKALSVSQKQFMIREHEMSHNKTLEKPRESPINGITMTQWLETAFQLQGIVPSELMVITEKIEVLKDREVLSNFNLSTSIIENGNFARNFATLQLTFFLMAEPDRRRYATFILQKVEQIEEALYYRITATLLPLNAETKESIFVRNLMPQLSTAIVAHDLRNNDKQVAEFKYMWQDAIDKISKGEKDKLTDEQRFVASITFQDAAEYLYRGRQLFNANRKYEAIMWLENGFHYLFLNYLKLNKEDKENFYEICFMLGFCYDDLQLYQRAFYYLNFTMGLNNITYTKEYVNCLTHSKDFRVFNYIDALLEELINNYQTNNSDEEAEEMPPHINDFMLFLYRRKAYALIDQEQYKEAKNMLESLIEIPLCSEFAHEELNYLQKIMDKQDKKEEIKQQNK
ncbi:hypothetical protein [Prevotella disiens]|uniref:Tetratricopeptide repeat protein n=1 Tax=Prevotella disiens DNF00882 TaxID=1401075 RepID=A0A096AU22_9BACT|nr:hypothetical protein [Prevotella disiens]KGF50235.1 hypothetical protein HMPREF0654_02160 [Prevotella disiens DNF00882]